jgi:hypothetical protein
LLKSFYKMLKTDGTLTWSTIDIFNIFEGT